MSESAGRSIARASGLRAPGVEDAKQLLEEKDFRNITEKTQPKTMADIEANMWKHNVKEGQRQHKDFLDTT